MLIMSLNGVFFWYYIYSKLYTTSVTEPPAKPLDTDTGIEAQTISAKVGHSRVPKPCHYLSHCNWQASDNCNTDFQTLSHWQLSDCERESC